MHGRTRLHRSGQVMVILLLAMSLLSSLVFYVVNIGDQVNRRVVVQNAADSAAISGATWMARSMNLVAMNNVAQSRMYALIPHLDSFPLSTRMAHEETASWVDALDRQLKRGVADTHLREGLESLHERMKKQRDILAPIDGFFRNEYDVTTATHWSIRGAGGAAASRASLAGGRQPGPAQPVGSGVGPGARPAQRGPLGRTQLRRNRLHGAAAAGLPGRPHGFRRLRGTGQEGPHSRPRLPASSRPL
jgi:hypothetical protein